MADYQSLLTRAVAHLPNASVAAARQTIYDRARSALVTQLRSLRPPLPDSDIEREERALDNAIAQVEQQFGQPNAPEEALPDAPISPAASIRTGSRADSRCEANAIERRLSAYAPRRRAAAGPGWPAPGDARPPVAAANPLQLATAARPPQVRAHPSRPPAPAAPTAPPQKPPAPAARSADAPAVKPPVQPVGSGVATAPRTAPHGPGKPPPLRMARDDRTGADAAPPVIMGRTDGEEAAAANLATVVPSAQADQSTIAGAPPVIASLADDAEPATIAPIEPIDVERIGSATRPEAEGQRPFAPTTIVEKRKSWPWLALAVVLGVVLSIAGAAILMRQKPQDLAIPAPPEAQQEAPQSPAKIAQRAMPPPAEGGASAPAPAEGEQQKAGQGAPNGAGRPTARGAKQLPAARRGESGHVDRLGRQSAEAGGQLRLDRVVDDPGFAWAGCLRRREGGRGHS